MVGLIKKIALYLVVILGVMYGYQLLTGNSITTLPGEIVDKLQQKDTKDESTNPRYYSDPAKRVPKE